LSPLCEISARLLVVALPVASFFGPLPSSVVFAPSSLLILPGAPFIVPARPPTSSHWPRKKEQSTIELEASQSQSQSQRAKAIATGPTDRPTDRTRGHEEGRVMGRDRFILPLLSICFIRFSPRPVHGSDASDATLLICLANFLDSQCLNYFVVSFRFVAVFASSSKPYCSRSLNLHSPHTALHWWHAGVVVAVVM
jgi:hypothetical protein